MLLLLNYFWDNRLDDVDTDYFWQNRLDVAVSAAEGCRPQPAVENIARCIQIAIKNESARTTFVHSISELLRNFGTTGATELTRPAWIYPYERQPSFLRFGFEYG